ncbi:hypothetical protein [Azospirillum largimobile]
MVEGAAGGAHGHHSEGRLQSGGKLTTPSVPVQHGVPRAGPRRPAVCTVRRAEWNWMGWQTNGMCRQLRKKCMIRTKRG